MKNRITFVFIDDIREIPRNEFKYGVAIRDFESAIEYLLTYANDFPIVVSFDHDLGEEKTGYDIAKYIVEHQIPLVGFRIHSANSVGKFNIQQLLTHYGYKEI